MNILKHLIKKKIITQSKLVDDFFKFIKKQDNKFNFINKFNNNYKRFNKDSIIGSIKSNFLWKDIISDASSLSLKNFKSYYDSTVVRLLNTKFNLLYNVVNDEFAMGSLGTYSKKVPKNLLFNNLFCGGSSSGSACSILSDCADFSIGSDTGGSVRLPSSFCDLIGFKPSYGAISRFGLIHFSSLFDTVGIISKDINIIKKVFNELFYQDLLDMTCYQFHNNFKINLKNKKKRLSNICFFGKDFFNIKGLNEKFNIFIHNLQKNFNIIFSSNLFYFKETLDLYKYITYSECVSTLNRYQNNIIYNANSNLFGNEIQKRIKLGKSFLKKGFYKEKLELVFKIRQKFEKEFSNIDIFIFPTLKTVVNNNMKITNVDELDFFNVLSNVLGFPSISIPFYKSYKHNKLDSIFSIQIMLKKEYDFELLNLIESFYNNKLI